VNFLYQTV